MSIDRTKISDSSTPLGSRQRTTAIASSNGSETLKNNDQSLNKRRRVRITTSTVENSPRPNNRRKNHSGENNHHNNEGSRKQYETSYLNQRSEGEFNYTYNKGKYNKSRKKVGGDFKKRDSRYSSTPMSPVKYKEVFDPETTIRLNKFLANSGVCSRREADEIIQAGEVSVNGIVTTALGSRVRYTDEVLCRGQKVSTESKVYVLLNKPKNCVTTAEDPECRLTVMDLVKNACSERIYPVGRLDRNTTGVLLITNDGDLASKLTHPSYKKKKIYQVWLDKPVTIEHMQLIADGIELEDGEIHADALSYIKEDDQSQVGIEIHSGRNRIVRRIFEHLGYHVVKLDRVYFAGLTKKNLPRGKWRYLDEQEVNNLRMGAF